VASSVPFHEANESMVKLRPETDTVRPSVPAAALSGEIENTEGIGLLFLTFKMCWFDTPPAGAGFITVIAFGPFEVGANRVAWRC